MRRTQNIGTKPTIAMATLIADTRDAAKDKRIPLTEAKQMVADGKAYQLVGIGQAWEPAFMLKEIWDRACIVRS